MTAVKFPRRYAQRKRLLAHKSLPKKSRKEAATNGNIASSIDPYPTSSSRANDESDSEYKSDQDSGYASSSSDAKAEYYRQKRAQFAAEGPIMAELSDASKAMVKTEEQKWNE
jgi:hypothetical protein